jgi:glyoxylase-like metal-dependent hydrolase (beta-lactamase superfamily II)
MDLTRIDVLDEVWRASASGARLEAARRLAPAFKEKVGASGTPSFVRTFDLTTFPYPTSFGLGGASLLPLPYVFMRYRMQVVQWMEGATRRTLLVNPLDRDRSAQAPFFAKQKRIVGDFLAEHVLSQRHLSIADALAAAGVRPESVDFVTFDHLHTQDVRGLLGTVDGTPALLPNAKLLAQKEELRTFEWMHPLQEPWYVKDGIRGVDPDKIVPIEGDYLVGPGVALVRTPGHTAGNQSIVLVTDDGVWTVSENGICADAYAPEASEIPGLRRFSRFYGSEVILNSNTRENTLDQYTSMVIEKLVSDPSRRRPEFPNHFSSSELVAHPLAPGIFPTFAHGAITHGAAS